MAHSKKSTASDLARLLGPRKGGAPVAAYKATPTDPKKLSQQAAALRFARTLLHH